MRLTVLFAIFLIFAATYAFTGCTPDVPPTPPPAIECYPEPGNECCPTELAGRYHLRGRTTKFFGKVAGRYQLRGRTKKFFGRVA